MNKEFKIGLWMVVLPVILTMIIPFWIKDPNDVARYAAGGQVFGALATFCTLIYILLDNIKRNEEEEERKNREIVALWQVNMPILKINRIDGPTQKQGKTELLTYIFEIENIGNADAFNLNIELSNELKTQRLTFFHLISKNKISLTDILNENSENHIDFIRNFCPKKQAKKAAIETKLTVSYSPTPINTLKYTTSCEIESKSQFIPANSPNLQREIYSIQAKVDNQLEIEINEN